MDTLRPKGLLAKGRRFERMDRPPDQDPVTRSARTTKRIGAGPT